MRLQLALFLSLLSTPTALTLATSPPSTLYQPANLTLPTALRPINDWTCQSGGSIFLHRPTLQDCNRAVPKLPQTGSTGAFHTIGAADGFQLPIVVTYGSCSVRIAIVEGWNWHETGSWEDIVHEAQALVGGCASAVVWDWFIGAETTAGERGKVEIQLEYAAEETVQA